MEAVPTPTVATWTERRARGTVTEGERARRLKPCALRLLAALRVRVRRITQIAQRRGRQVLRRCAVGIRATLLTWTVIMMGSGVSDLRACAYRRGILRNKLAILAILGFVSGAAQANEPVPPVEAEAAATTLARQATPRGNPGRWITYRDSPGSKAMAGERLRSVRFELTIDRAGQVTGCNIIVSSGAPAVDEHTCKLLLTRAEFDPAVGADGETVASTWTNSFKWEVSK